MSDLIVEVRDLHHTYCTDGVETAVLHGLGLSVCRAEFVLIMGQSGCGKTTLLHLLGLMTGPTRAASLSIDGQETLELSERQRAQLRRTKIGFVFQRFNLLSTISAEANIRTAMRLRNLRGDGRMDRLLDELDIAEVRRKKPGALSIGEQQRVAIARALVCRPALLLADEPTGNLDSANAERLMRILRDTQRRHGQTTIMVTHNEHLAHWADRVLEMKDGRFRDS